MTDSWEDLNEPQQAAVMHVDGPLLVLAGPGSGKTRVVTHRIVHLLREGVPNERIVALTFTNKAAGEMLRRVGEIVPGARTQISTFHRFCARLLRRYAPLVGLEPNFTIYDSSDSVDAMKSAVDALSIDLRADWGLTPEQVLSGLSRAKNSLVPLEERPLSRFLNEPLATGVARLGPLYQARLLSANAVDFDDLLRHVALLLSENPEVRSRLDEQYAYVLVDEYQDTNRAQYAIVRAVSVDQPNLAVTGDPDQSIYSWRGANIRNILQFEEDYPQAKVIKLEQNYRSTPEILSAADAVIGHNTRRKAKRLFTNHASGAPVVLTHYESYLDEARDIAARLADAASVGRSWRDFAIMYRTNALSRVLEGALRASGIAYQVVNAVEFYQRREVKDLLAYLHLLNNPRNDVALERIINVPPRGIGQRTLDTVRQEARARRVTMLEAVRIVAGGNLLATRFRKALQEFVQLFDGLAANGTDSVEILLRQILTETGYARRLGEMALEEDVDRLENVEELLSAAGEFDEHAGAGLEGFLEDKSLVADTDGLSSAEDRVALMTLHSAKGLEFPVVFLVGLEAGLLPHERSRHDPDSLEEERRLLFVGMTRAREQLFLSHARYRGSHGSPRLSVPSPFLMELPLDELERADRTAFFAGRVREDLELPPEEQEFLREYADTAQDADSDTEFRPPARKRRAPHGMPVLQTAAQLLTEAFPPSAASPNDFTLGMIVHHPEHGLGKIVGLDGRDNARRARVRFATSEFEKTFILKHSALTPAKSGDADES